MSVKRASTVQQQESLAGLRRAHLAAEQQAGQQQQLQRGGGGSGCGRPDGKEGAGLRTQMQMQPDESRWASRTMLPGLTGLTPASLLFGLHA